MKPNKKERIAVDIDEYTKGRNDFIKNVFNLTEEDLNKGEQNE